MGISFKHLGFVFNFRMLYKDSTNISNQRIVFSKSMISLHHAKKSLAKIWTNMILPIFLKNLFLFLIHAPLILTHIECLLYLPNVRAIQYKLRVGPEKWTRLGNTNVLRLPVGQSKIVVWQNQTYKEYNFQYKHHKSKKNPWMFKMNTKTMPNSTENKPGTILFAVKIIRPISK